jgi:nicotinate-nucleotide--dimethylbenzimidazole phosphoribosyltransferase
MSDAQALEAIARGAAIVRELDADAIGLGEMGIGNTSAAALLAARLLPAPLDDCVGRGTGLDDARLAHKRAVLRRCLDAHPETRTPLAALAAFGGFETAMMVGAVLAAAAMRRPVVVDGFVASAAVLVAARLAPAVLGHCVFAHRSAEAGHGPLLAALDARPLLDLDLRLGEGSGAALAMPLVRAAARLLAEMATFESAGVSTGPAADPGR